MISNTYLKELCVFVVCLVSAIKGFTVKQRLNYLEMQVSRESLKTKTDIMDLRNEIASLNFTTFGRDMEPGSSGDVKTPEFLSLVAKVENFMAEQSKRMTVLEKAFTDEKIITRETAKKIGPSVLNNRDKFKAELEMSIHEVSNRLEKEKFQRNMSTTDIFSKLTELATGITNLNDRLDKMEIQGVSRPAPLPCPTNWTQWKDVCYLHVLNELVSWDVANMRCHDHSGILAEPDSKEAMLFLFSHVAPATSSNNVWIGATDEETDGMWIFMTSKKNVEYLQWERGQPNNFGGKQDCMEMYKMNINDEKCEASNQYVCQRDVSKP